MSFPEVQAVQTAGTPSLTDMEYLGIKKNVRDLLGLDLSAYKERQMRRRIGAYVRRAGFSAWNDYLNLLRAKPEERRRLTDYLLINVSEFFRDPEMWSRLETDILPGLLQERPRLRMWSAGCSIGAELYSMAILLTESAPFAQHMLLGTDIDDDALSIAKEGGPYAEKQIDALPAERIETFFRREQENHINPKLMAWSNFKKLDLLRDSYPADYDLIMCRNVVIYFTQDAKSKVCQSLTYSLRPGGIMILGGTEFLGNPDKYGLVHIGPSTYRRIAA